LGDEREKNATVLEGGEKQNWKIGEKRLSSSSPKLVGTRSKSGIKLKQDGTEKPKWRRAIVVGEEG